MEKKILTAVTIVFFIVMLAFTFISRKTAIELLPRVEAVYAEDGVTFPANCRLHGSVGQQLRICDCRRKKLIGHGRGRPQNQCRDTKRTGRRNNL